MRVFWLCCVLLLTGFVHGQETPRTSPIEVSDLSFFSNVGNSFTPADSQTSIPLTNTGLTMAIKTQRGQMFGGNIGYTNSPLQSKSLYYSFRLLGFDKPHYGKAKLDDSLALRRYRQKAETIANSSQEIQRQIDSIRWIKRLSSINVRGAADTSINHNHLDSNLIDLDQKQDSIVSIYKETRQLIDSLESTIEAYKNWKPKLSLTQLQIGRFQIQHDAIPIGTLVLNGLSTSVVIKERWLINAYAGKTALNSNSAQRITPTQSAGVGLKYLISKWKSLGMIYNQFNRKHQDIFRYINLNYSHKHKLFNQYHSLTFQLNRKFAALWRSNLSYNISKRWLIETDLVLPIGRMINPIKSVFTIPSSPQEIYRLSFSRRSKRSKYKIELESRKRKSALIQFANRKIKLIQSVKIGKRLRLLNTAHISDNSWKVKTNGFASNVTLIQILSNLTWKVNRRILIVNSINYTEVFSGYRQQVFSNNISGIFNWNRWQLSGRIGIRNNNNSVTTQEEIGITRNFKSGIISLTLIHDPISGQRILGNIGINAKKLNISAQLIYGNTPSISYQEPISPNENQRESTTPIISNYLTQYQINLSLRYKLIGK